MHCTERQNTYRLLTALFLSILAACAPVKGPDKTGGEGQPSPNPYLLQTSRVPQAAQNGMEIAHQAYKNGDLARAESELTKLTENWPNLSGPWLNLGIVQERQDRPEAAEQSLNRAITANGDNVFAHNQLAALLRDAGRFGEAEEHYRQALKLWPDYADAHINLGILYDLYLHRPEEALQHYRAAQALREEEDRQLAGWIVDLERRL